MFHSKRVWQVVELEEESELVQKIHNGTWTLCTAFKLQDYLFLNDSTSEDAVQEYAIVKQIGDKFVQIEWVTFGWCDFAGVRRYVRDVMSGSWDNNDFAREVEPKLEGQQKHGRCSLCA